MDREIWKQLKKEICLYTGAEAVTVDGNFIILSFGRTKNATWPIPAIKNATVQEILDVLEVPGLLGTCELSTIGERLAKKEAQSS